MHSQGPVAVFLSLFLMVIQNVYGGIVHEMCLPGAPGEITMTFADQTPCGSGSYISVITATTGYRLGYDYCTGNPYTAECELHINDPHTYNGGETLYQTILTSCNGKRRCSNFNVRSLMVACALSSGHSTFLDIEYDCLSEPTTGVPTSASPTDELGTSTTAPNYDPPNPADMEAIPIDDDSNEEHPGSPSYYAALGIAVPVIVASTLPVTAVIVTCLKMRRAHSKS